MEKFPDTKVFSNVVLNVFSSVPRNVPITHQATFKESHKDSILQQYRMTVKLSGARRSYGVEKHFREKDSISVNFSSEHCGLPLCLQGQSSPPNSSQSRTRELNAHWPFPQDQKSHENIFCKQQKRKIHCSSLFFFNCNSFINSTQSTQK